MDRIVPVKDLAGVLKKLHQEGYTSIVVVPLAMKKMENYGTPKLCLGGDKLDLTNDLWVVQSYHVVAHKELKWWQKIFN